MKHSDLLDRMLQTGQPRQAWLVTRPSTVPEQPRSTEVLSPWVRRNLDNRQHPHATTR
jgi:hypothetical protein